MGTKWGAQRQPTTARIYTARPRPGRDLWMIEGSDLFAQVIAALRRHQPHTGPLPGTDDTTEENQR